MDNGSCDGTQEVLQRAREYLPLCCLFEPRPGKNRALNRGLAIARGRLLVFTDDDIVAEPDWLTALVSAASRWPEDSVFGGRIVPRFPPSTPDWLRNSRRASTWFAIYHPAECESPVVWPPFGPNMAIRRDVFSAVRFCEGVGPAGRNYVMGSETELLLRLRAVGFRFIYVPSAKVQHVVRQEQTTLRWLYGRAFRFGRSEARLHPDRNSRRLFGAPRYLRAKSPWRFCDKGRASCKVGHIGLSRPIFSFGCWGSVTSIARAVVARKDVTDDIRRLLRHAD